MISTIYTIDTVTNKSLQSLEMSISQSFGRCDFFLFTIASGMDIEIAAKNIRDIFKTDNFVIYHAIEHFNNTKIVENSLSVCCFQFEKNAALQTFYVEDISDDTDIQKTIEYFNNNNDKFHIIIAGLCNGSISTIVDKISEQLNYSPIDNIVGGVSSGISIDNELQTYQYINNRVIKNGFVILSFEGVDAEIDISLGFQPYGITYEITKADGNKLYTVDDGKSFAYIAKKMLCNTGEEVDIRNLWYCPLSILTSEDGYTSTLRTIENVTESYVEFFSPVKKGEHFKLSFATPQDLIQSDERTAKRLVEKLQEPELSFNFSCIARQYVLEDMQQKEIETYVEHFKTNLFGFFTFGEIGPDTLYKKLKFYNETSLVVTMRES